MYMYFPFSLLFSRICVCFQKREREFENYLHEKVQKAKSDFRELLKECKIITYK